MNRINTNRTRYRCGYRRLQSYCPESSSIMQVSRPSDYYHGVLNALPTVPDSYIGTVSSSMFAGMMVGAVGWGTCKVNSHSHIQIIKLIRTKAPISWDELQPLTQLFFSLPSLVSWHLSQIHSLLFASHFSCWEVQ